MSPWFAQCGNSIQSALLFFLMIFVLRVILRRQWLAATVFTLIFTLMKLGATNYPWIDVPAQLMVYSIAAVVVVRFGLIALAAGIFGSMLVT